MNQDSTMEMGFLDHLEELRWRIVKALIAILVGSAISFGYIDEVLAFLLQPTKKRHYYLNYDPKNQLAH